MSNLIFTQRLQLISLNLNQLEMILHDLEVFEMSLQITMKRDFITERVHRAIGMKMEKMQKTDVSHHDWLTYWLVIIRDEMVGAGMLGFKGFPDESGSTEIGYGIDPAYQGKGYMSEAIRALIDWAFTHPFCKVITASEVENPASRRLLERLGARLVNSTEHSTSWEIRKLPG
ncbi:MAG TPA: GNAT family N-acetyltransferase [Anaerolineales bacterium]|nr:GNAT family N-acetyltransferase [Anaerolineales bacterium]